MSNQLSPNLSSNSLNNSENHLSDNKIEIIDYLSLMKTQHKSLYYNTEFENTQNMYDFLRALVEKAHIEKTLSSEAKTSSSKTKI